MKPVSIFVLGFSIYCSSLLYGAPEFFQPVKHPISVALIPEGFDNNDSVQFVISGSFKSNCFQVGIVDTEFVEDEGRLNIGLSAYEYTGKCSDYPVTFHQVARVGLIRTPGTYGVYDRNSGNYLGALKIDPAKPVGAGTDEASYAPLLDAYLTKQKGKNILNLSGTFTSSCLEVKSVEVLPAKKVVVVLPKIGPKEGEKCEPGDYPLTHTHEVQETLPTTKYLLHVRSMGGEAINKVIVP